MTEISRVGTSQNLEDGGTFDLLIMGFPNGFPRGYVSFEIGDTPRRVTGVQKVVQTFLLALLTDKGSDPVHPNRGTDFNNYVAGANVGTDYEELTTVIRHCIQDAETQTKATLNGNANDTASQLASVDIGFVEAVSETLNIGLRILTLDGNTASVAIPFPQTDLALNG